MLLLFGKSPFTFKPVPRCPYTSINFTLSVFIIRSDYRVWFLYICVDDFYYDNFISFIILTKIISVLKCEFLLMYGECSILFCTIYFFHKFVHFVLFLLFHRNCSVCTRKYLFLTVHWFHAWRTEPTLIF